eukprot:SAG11_NODE_13487_length_653_cov_1.160650_1_plen_174_part_10
MLSGRGGSSPLTRPFSPYSNRFSTVTTDTRCSRPRFAGLHGFRRRSKWRHIRWVRRWDSASQYRDWRCSKFQRKQRSIECPAVKNRRGNDNSREIDRKFGRLNRRSLPKLSRCAQWSVFSKQCHAVSAGLCSKFQQKWISSQCRTVNSKFEYSSRGQNVVFREQKRSVPARVGF